ncbi:MAG: divalent-cation tolerance protein CutA [Pseudomonadota bacterium]
MAKTARVALIYTPLPDVETARTIAGHLLDERLIACANILGAMESVFVWNGKRDSARETAVLFKTDDARLDDAVARLGALHPYDTPAIVAWVCDAAHQETLGWLAAQLGPPSPDAA